MRLRRELHDGLGPTLAALGLKVDRARLDAASDPSAVAPLLEEIRADLRGALAQIRTLSRELRPPGLDALGLVDAVRQQVATIGGPAGPAVTVDADEVGALPPAIEVTAYRIVVEAVTNVVRHADARACVVRIARGPDALLIEVTDDGSGIRAGHVGVGTRAMYERAAEVGGEVLVGPGEDGGTIVRASLPVVPAPPVAATANTTASGDRPRAAETIEQVTES